MGWVGGEWARWVGGGRGGGHQHVQRGATKVASFEDADFSICDAVARDAQGPLSDSLHVP